MTQGFDALVRTRARFEAQPVDGPAVDDRDRRRHRHRPVSRQRLRHRLCRSECARQLCHRRGHQLAADGLSRRDDGRSSDLGCVRRLRRVLYRAARRLPRALRVLVMHRARGRHRGQRDRPVHAVLVSRCAWLVLDRRFLIRAHRDQCAEREHVRLRRVRILDVQDCSDRGLPASGCVLRDECARGFRRRLSKTIRRMAASSRRAFGECGLR